MDNKQRLCGMLGFAMRAGKLTIGTDLSCRAMAQTGAKKPVLIAAASDISDGTKKKIFTKAAFYGIDAIALPLSKSELGALLGKTTAPACVAVLDGGFAAEILKAQHTPELN